LPLWWRWLVTVTGAKQSSHGFVRLGKPRAANGAETSFSGIDRHRLEIAELNKTARRDENIALLQQDFP